MYGALRVVYITAVSAASVDFQHLKQLWQSKKIFWSYTFRHDSQHLHWRVAVQALVHYWLLQRYSFYSVEALPTFLETKDLLSSSRYRYSSSGPRESEQDRCSLGSSFEESLCITFDDVILKGTGSDESSQSF